MKRLSGFLIIFLTLLVIVIGHLFIPKVDLPQNPNPSHLVKIIEDKTSLINLPVYLAISKGFFTEENIKISLITAAKGEEPLEIIQEGKTSDVFLCGPEEMIYSYQIKEKSDLKYFYSLSQREGSYIIGKKSLPDFSLEMLKKRSIIGAPRGTLREMVLEKFLHDNNLIPQRSLNIIQTLTAPDNIIAYISGSCDYIYISEPEAGRIISEGTVFNKISLADKIPPLLNIGLITSDKYMNKHQKELQSLTNAIYKSQLWIKYKPINQYIDQIKSYYPDYTKIELINAIQNYKRSSVWTTDPTPTEENFRVLQTIMDSAGELRNQLDPKLFLEKRFTLKAIKTIKKEEILSPRN